MIFINGLKDFIEDYKRKKSDDEENNKLALVFDKLLNKFIFKKWAEIKLGDIIKVKKDEYFPADLVLINTSEKEGNCFIETKNLDGETNLKFKQAHHELSIRYSDEKNLGNFNGILKTKAPNQHIYEFDAIMMVIDEINYPEINKEANGMENYNNNVKGKNNLKNILNNKIIINKNSFLLRGCSLKHANYITGISVYVGHHTKIMKNSPNTRSKSSKLEIIMNKQIFIILAFQLFLSTIACVFYIIRTNKNSEDLSYIFHSNHAGIGFRIFIFRIGTWVLIFTNLVPISLLVSLEMIKYFQGMYISWDVEIYDEKMNIPAKVQTSTLNEELGQVKVFID